MYLGGGAMSGCYGAGVLKGLYNHKFVDNIEAIYTTSVGSLNASYLLSNQAEIGPTIYFEDLQKGFIYPYNLFIGILDLIWNRFIKNIKNDDAHNVVDINYVYDILSRKKALNLDAIKNNPVDLFIKVLDVDSGEISYKSFKEYPTLDLLKASITIKPYFFEETTIDGSRYIDASIKEPLGIEHLLNKYPDRKILIVLNEPIVRGFRHHLKNLIEGIVSGLYPYKISLFRFYKNRESLIRKDIEICLKNKNILLLYPNLNNRTRPRTTDSSRVKETFDSGVSDSRKIIDFIR